MDLLLLRIYELCTDILGNYEFRLFIKIDNHWNFYKKKLRIDFSRPNPNAIVTFHYFILKRQFQQNCTINLSIQWKYFKK